MDFKSAVTKTTIEKYFSYFMLVITNVICIQITVYHSFKEKNSVLVVVHCCKNYLNNEFMVLKNFEFL